MLVLGDALLDGWLSGPARRLGRDGPVPVVELVDSHSACGGAANTAANLAALGATVDLLAVFGDDGESRILRALLADAGVRTDACVIELGRTTPVKRRLVAGGQHVARYDVAPVAPPRRSTRSALVDALTEALRRADGRPDAVLVADYGLGIADRRGPRAARRAARRDPAAGRRRPRPAGLVRGPPRRRHAERGGGGGAARCRPSRCTTAPRGPPRSATRWWRRAVARTCCSRSTSTAWSGCPPTRPSRCSAPRAHPTAQSRACGAGDTFTAAYTAARCTDLPPPVALAVAQAAADVVVGREETAVCTTGALTAQLAAADRGGLLSHRDLLAVVDEHRRRGHRVVFTNGCFDVLHRGHVTYLRQARALGDLLVVALNSDDSVARLKGPERPVNPLADRAGVVGAIECVDLVTAFSEDTPAGLIELVRPEVYAKGGDYTPEMLPETPIVERLGGQVRVLDYLSDHSTTAIVTRIRATPADRGRAR